jgi:hypothetical protein
LTLRKLGLGTAVAVSCALMWAGAAVAMPASQGFAVQGNRQGVALAERALSGFAGAPAFTYSERGFFQIHAAPGATPNVTYYYGYGALHPGFAWAAEHGTVALHNNQVIWWRDDLVPLGSHQPSVELVADSQGVFSALGNASHHSCFTAVEGSVPYPYGGQAYSINGRYLNGTSPLRSIYRWFSTNQPASETDGLSAGGLITSGRIVVSAGSGLSGFTVYFSNAFLGGAPAAPQVNLCR